MLRLREEGDRQLGPAKMLFALQTMNLPCKNKSSPVKEPLFLCGCKNSQ